MASSDTDDEDLRFALTLSMQPSSPKALNRPVANSETIDLTADADDDDDEDMRRAIALSLQTCRHSRSPKLHVSERPSYIGTSSGCAAKVNTANQPAGRAASSSAELDGRLEFSQLNRKAMEQERLARLGKRKRDASPDQSSKHVTKNERPSPDRHPFDAGSKEVPKTKLQYPRGAIKRTFATKFPRTDDITIDEVLQADSIHTAVISSFMWDPEWLHEKLNPLNVKQIWIMNAKGKEVQQRLGRELKATGTPNLRIHFPPMEGLIYSMHSKFMLLYGQDKLRIVVCTANMTRIDWGEVMNDWQPGVMENSVFLVDVPRRGDGVVGKKEDLTRFGQELVYFLDRQQIDRKVIEGVLKFDFAQTAHLAFVHAIGGVHTDESERATGLPGLAKAVRDMQLDDVKALELDYASASLGAINDKFLQRLYAAAQGKRWTSASAVGRVRDHVRIYFPTHEAVVNSIGGADCGGIISLTRQAYHAASFPRECLRSYESTRRGMLSHNKLLFVRGVDGDNKAFAWVYVGSANLSESAWGVQQEGQGKQRGSLRVRNWECGVVMRVAAEKVAAMRLGEGAMAGMEVFGGTVEVPFACPEPSWGRYGGGGRPWFRLG